MQRPLLCISIAREMGGEEAAKALPLVGMPFQPHHVPQGGEVLAPALGELCQ